MILILITIFLTAFVAFIIGGNVGSFYEKRQSAKRNADWIASHKNWTAQNIEDKQTIADLRASLKKHAEEFLKVSDKVNSDNVNIQNTIQSKNEEIERLQKLNKNLTKQIADNQIALEEYHMTLKSVEREKNKLSELIEKFRFILNPQKENEN